MAVFEQKKSAKVTLDDTVPLTCTFETAQSQKDYTEYVIKIQRGPVPDNSWTVTKRYSDFAALDGIIRATGIELPLPPKKVFGNMDREFIAERQQGLQTYLNFVLNHPMLASSLLVKRFLDADNYGMNFQEIALQHISMFFRSEPQWEVVEPLPEMGWRLRKQYFMVKSKITPKAKNVLAWTSLGPDKFLSDKDLHSIMKLLPSFQHPYIYNVTLASANENGGLTIRAFHEKGTIRDQLCKTKPKERFLKKYGSPKSITNCQLSAIKIYGRQILETIKYMHDKSFPYGHLHTGNILIEDSKVKLLDIENWLLGLPAYYRAYITPFRKIQTLELIDVYSFGQVLYELTFGQPLKAATCDNYPPQCPAEIRSVLESILTTEACKNGLPTLSDLLLHPLFSDVVLPAADRPQIKIPSKLKEALKEARTAVEKRLKDEQKVINQFKRLSKAQAYHMSEEEKKKRRKSKKKSMAEGKGDENGETSSGLTSPASSATPGSGGNSKSPSPVPPPAPPPPAATES